MSKTKTLATLNFANMNDSVLEMLSNCQLAINELAVNENTLKAVRESGKKAGLDKEGLKTYTEKERKAVKASKDRATEMCEVFIIRNIDVADAVKCDLYHFDMVAFLKNIGALSDGEIDKKVINKVERIRNAVVDRTQYYVARRKKGEDKLSQADSKDIKNTPIELVLSIVFAVVNSGAIDYCGGGLAKVDFSKDEKTE